MQLFSVGLADSPVGGGGGGVSPRISSGEKPQAHHEKDMTSQLMHHLQNLNKQQDNHVRLPMQDKFIKNRHLSQLYTQANQDQNYLQYQKKEPSDTQKVLNSMIQRFRPSQSKKVL